MAVIIPWQDSPDFQFEVSLDGTVYLFRARWNVRAEAWALDILTRATTPLILGIRVAHSVDLLAATVLGAPPGAMYVMGPDPTYENVVSGACQLVYLAEAET